MARLKLKALDKEDLQVISSCVQDAVLKIGELRFIPKEKRFVLSFNRFTWEITGAKERRRSVLHFDRVLSAKVQGINPADKETIISLLAMTFEESDAPGGTIELVFAGDGAIRLEVECIECQLSDLTAAWQAGNTPAHD